MGPGTYVGRVGALAVALGLGAAVFIGQPTAYAKPADTSGSDTSTPSTSADTKSSTADGAEKSEASTETDTKTEDAPKRKKKSKSAQSAADDVKHEDQDTAPRTRSVRTEKAPADQEDAKDTGAVADQQPAAVAKTPEPAVADVVVKTATVQESTTAKKAEPKDPVTVTISRVVSALVSPFAGDGGEPAQPADSPAIWTLAAAARREFLGSVPALDKEGAPTATTLVADATLAAKTAETAETAEADEPPQPVRAIPVTSLLAPLQQIPIVGQLFVTPVVSIVHSIPFVGDILHPFIGYPVGMTGGTTPRDYKVISSDGTAIYVHFFPARNVAPGTPAPTILNGPGLGLPGETNPLAVDNPFLPHQVIGMGTLLDGGYNVVTWDPRGEWGSHGRLEIDHPEFEGQDMKAIISFIAEQPEAELDNEELLDPRIGMVGVSYGGGIQLVTAAIDKRVDAIVPTIAWNDLNTALAKNGAPKTSWGLELGAALLLTGARTDRNIFPALIGTLLAGGVSDDDEAFLNERSPFGLLDDITAPTLLIQGTVDTLFTLQEAHENAVVLMQNGVPTKVVWYCGGHGGCITSQNNGDVIEQATMSWLEKYVKGLDVSTGPQFEWVDQHGQNFSSDKYPVPAGTPLTVTSDEPKSLPLRLLFGGSGPNFAAFAAGPINGLLGFLSGSKAANAIELTTTESTTTQYVVGAPKLKLTYSGTGTSTHVYAQLVDNTTGLVLGNQVTPIPVMLDGESHDIEIPLEQVAHTLAPGETLTLQLVSSAVTYQPIRGRGELEVTSMTLTLPTANAAGIHLPA